MGLDMTQSNYDPHEEEDYSDFAEDKSIAFNVIAIVVSGLVLGFIGASCLLWVVVNIANQLLN